MGRRGPAKLKLIKKDPVYDSQLVTKLINKIMYSGKKTVAQKQVYKALEIAEKKTKKKGDQVLEEAVDNIKPDLEVRSRRIGGAAYQVPLPVGSRRKESLAIKWLVMAARKRSNSTYHTFAQKLGAELIDAYGREGGAVTKRQEIEKLAEANRAFAHLRW